MKKTRFYFKRVVLLAILVLLTFSVHVFAYESVAYSTEGIVVDGQSYRCETYIIDGYRYIKMRDLADAVGFDVGYDVAANSIVITTFGVYTPVGSEGQISGDLSSTITETTQSLIIDGNPVDDVPVYNLGGYNFLQIAGLARYLSLTMINDDTLRTYDPGSITSTPIRLDLANGSIYTAEKPDCVVYAQSGTTFRGTGGCIVQQGNSGAVATANTITVTSGEVELTIADLNVESEDSPISVEEGASLTLNLMGSNAMKSMASAGIKIPEGAALTIQGSGAVTATGSYYEGIGAGRWDDCGTITITGGTITATGGSSGAGIGGNGGTVTITGGTVIATGAGAGIGGGGNGGTVTITGGTVVATSFSGAGIGGNGGTVYIENATVSASGGYNAIGGVPKNNVYGCDSITISNSDMTYSRQYDGGYDCQERIDYTSPLDQAALSGNNAQFSVTASGHSGISYQWQSSPDNENWTDEDGQTDATADIPVSADNDGYYYRCKLTNGWGNEVYTDAARAYVLAFARQPESVETNLNGVVSLAAASACGNVTYQWQRSYDEGESWTEVPGQGYPTLIVSATLAENDALYRCMITAENGDALASDAARITVQSSAITYTTNYYKERTDGSGYDLSEREVTEAVAGESVAAPERSYEHFTENTAMGTHSGTVTADGSLVLARYFDRDVYTITFETNGGAALGPISAKYGAEVTASETARPGYSFAGWYADAELTEEYTFSTMPGENITIYAKWTAVGAGRGIEYQINGVALRDSAYQAVGAIPTGFFYAEVSVTNLSSVTTDTLVLATYDRNGKMLHTYFLYANPQIGQTFVLGAGIDNSMGSVKKIKAFMLPALGGVVPLAEAMEISG